jgi:prolyl 4-hydroxylase
MSAVDKARSLLAAGQREQAIDELERAGDKGDGSSWFELGVWFLSGGQVARDLRRSREYIRRAAEAGDARASSIYMSFVAIGVGAEPDWPAAFKLLRQAAPDDPSAATQLTLFDAMKLSSSGDPLVAPPKRKLSDAPQVWLFERLLSEAECAHVIARARPLLQPSVVVDPITGQLRPDPVRTSDGAAFPWALEDLVIHALNRRIAAASGTDLAAGELLHVLRYAPGQEYRPHFDAFNRIDNQRIFTMLVYLNEGYGGGETLFTHNGLKVAGRTGDAILFRNADGIGRRDETSQHAGLPVTAGEKFLATRWIRQRPISF